MRAHRVVRGRLWAILLGALIAAVVAYLVVFVQSGKAIVGGTSVTNDSTYPFMVALLHKNKSGDQVQRYFCAGSLITPKHVLTAAHCVENKKANDIEVVAGRATLRPNPAGNGQLWSVAENGVVPHGDYKKPPNESNPMAYDVAVLKLASATGRKPGKPIALADSSHDLLEQPGTITTVAGWGRTSNSSTTKPNEMHQLAVPIVPDDEAKFRYRPDYLPTIMLAYGGQKGKGTCTGDSGAPVFAGAGDIGIQIGVHHGKGGEFCGQEGYPKVGAEVNAPEIRNFITKQIAVNPGANGKIYFARSVAGNRSVWSMNPDGTGQTKLLGNNDNSAEDNPAVSPDGARIAYVFANNDIHVMNADGGGVKRITTDRNSNQDPAWAPDNKRIVFSRKGLQNRQDLFVVNSDGTGLRNLTNTKDISEEDPAWSPDGSQIAYTAVGCAGGGRCVYVMAASGTNKPENLTNEPRLPGCESTHRGHLGSSAEPHWSPDKSQDGVYKIVFSGTVSCRNSSGFDIWVMNADGNSKKNLTNDNGTVDRHPVFSPDYKQIAFQRDDGDIYTMQVTNTTDKVNITKTAGVAEETPHWGPTPKR